MKFNTIIIFIFQGLCIVTMSSFLEKEKCGAGKFTNGRVEFFICNEMFNQDTIFNDDNRWFSESEFSEMINVDEYKNVPFTEWLPIMSNSWLSEFDTIVFYLPRDCKIIDAKQSFVIVPSIWAKEGDDVLQYFAFDNLKSLCIDPQVLEIENNTILNPFRINEKDAIELYFKNNKEISKNDLLTSLNSYFYSQELYLKNTEFNDFFTPIDQKKFLKENQDTKDVYVSYLRNYVNWEQAPADQFMLLDVEAYLTLTIHNGTSLNKLTFICKPVIGN